MAKLTLTDIANTSSTSTVAAINANNAAIEAAMENTLSRDGSTPNTMGANLDMNSNRIVNLPEPQSPNDAARKSYVDLVASTGVVGPKGDKGDTGDLTLLSSAPSVTSIDPTDIFPISQSVDGDGNYVFSTATAQQIFDFVGESNYISSLSGLKSIDTTSFQTAYLKEANREGMFNFINSDLSSILVDRVLETTGITASTDSAELRLASTTSVDNVTNIATSASHGFSNGQRVFTASSVNGLVAGECYAIVNATTNTFQLSRSVGGSPISFTGTTNFTIRQHHQLSTGDVVVLSTTSGPLVANTRYYAITDTNPRTFKFATSRTNAYNNVAIDIPTNLGPTQIHVLTDPYEGVYVIPNGFDLKGTQGAWKRSYGSHGLNVKWFGALGNGSNIDHGPIQYAVRMAARWGGLVNIPTGSYIVDDKIVVNGSVRIQGEIAAVQFFPHGERTGFVLSGSNYPGSWIRLATGAALSRGWTTTDANDHGVIEFVYDNPTYGGGYVDQRRFSGMEHVGINAHGGGQNASTLYCGILVKSAWHVNLRRNIVILPRGHAIGGNVTSIYNSLNNALITENYCYGNPSFSVYGIYSVWGDSQVFGNHITGFQTGLHCASGGVNITLNKIEGNDLGVFLSSIVRMWTMTANMIYDNQTNGVVISGVDNVSETDDAVGTLTGNGIYSNGKDTGATNQERAGVSILGTSAGLTISGNSFGNFAPLPTTQTWGIFCSASNFRGTVVGNGHYNHTVGNESFASGAVLLDGTNGFRGTGTPEGSLSAPVGSIYRRLNGGANTTLYIKESGTGNTGWVAK